MFICKQVVVFFILLNFVSSFCATVPEDVDPWSDEHIWSNSSEEDDDENFYLDFIIFAILRFLQSIFNSGSEMLNPDDFDNHLDTNSQTKMALVAWVSDSNEDTENYFLESYPDENSESNSDENTESNSDENTESNLDETTESNGDENTENQLKKLCSKEDQSIISHSDIQYLIEEKAEILKIKEKIVNSYYINVEGVIKNHKDDIEEYKKRFLERPGHMFHVLDSIKSRREGLGPKVEEIADQLEQIQTLEDNFDEVARASAVTFNQLNKYKKLCEINCEEINVENRFGDEIINNSLIVSNRTGIYCIRLKELNDYINEKLSEEQAQYGDGLDQPLEEKDKLYGKNISDLKTNLKKAAVTQFGMTMYEILSLQDDYHHFIKDLENINIASKIHNLKETTAEIGYIRYGLKRDLDKYRQYCMKCGNKRVKRNVLNYHEGRRLEGLEDSVLSTEKIKQTVDELIQAKINEIRDDIESNVTAMFSELDEMFNDHTVIENYVRELHKIQGEIDTGIETEKEAFKRLKSRIPEESIDKITDLSEQSRKLKQELESAKLFIEHFDQKF